MDAMREELDLSRRELGRVVGREKAHRGDGEIKIAELANTVRMLAGKSDAHAVAAAARQDLLAEQLTVHHLRADVEAYRSLLDAEQARITSLKRDLETSKSLLDASGVVETILHVPGVSAQKVIETFAVKIFKLEHRLAASQDECGKIKLKIGDGFALRDVPSGVPVGVGRGPHLGGLLGSTSRAKVINLDIKSKRGRSVSPISTRLGRPGMAIAERANREGSVECISGAEFRVRSNLVGGDAEDGEIYSPPSLTCSPADSAGAAAHIWEALAPCVQNQSPDSLVDSLNTALMARRLALQADQINTLEEKVSILETEKTDILEKRLRQEVDENDRTRIDLDTCNRRLELSESTQRLALEDLRRARERILELEKDAIHRRLFGQPAAAVEGAGCSNAVAGKSGRYYECMTDSDEDGDKSPQDTDHSMNTSSDSDAVDREQQRRLVQRLKVCERELHQNKDLLRERTLQLKILMQTVEAVQHSSVEEERYGDAECRLGLEDIARAPIGTIGQTQSGGRSGTAHLRRRSLRFKYVSMVHELCFV